MKDIPRCPRLEVADLQLVVALAVAGSTAQAAPLLHLSQSAVSRALLGVEDKLGARLFARTARGLKPTAAGSRLVAGARQLLGELGELERRVAAPVTPPTRVRLVCECYTAYHWLPTVLANLRQTLPELEVALAVEHTNEPVAALEDGDVDVALLTTARVPRGELEERELFSDEVIFVLSPAHPLAAKSTLTRSDLRTCTLVSGNVPTGEARWFSAKVFGRARPRIRFQRVPLTEAILDVVRAQMGVAVLSEWIVAPHLGRGDLVARRLSTGALHRSWRIAWRRESRDAALRLATALAATVPSARRPRRLAAAIS
jgi:LysR family transcriptional regulator for metE and metH